MAAFNPSFANAYEAPACLLAHRSTSRMSARQRTSSRQAAQADATASGSATAPLNAASRSSSRWNRDGTSWPSRTRRSGRFRERRASPSRVTSGAAAITRRMHGSESLTPLQVLTRQHPRGGDSGVLISGVTITQSPRGPGSDSITLAQDAPETSGYLGPNVTFSLGLKNTSFARSGGILKRVGARPAAHPRRQVEDVHPPNLIGRSRRQLEGTEMFTSDWDNIHPSWMHI